MNARPSSVFADVLRDPGHEMSDACVNARILSLAAANAPGYDTGLCPFPLVHHQRTAGVALGKKRINLFKRSPSINFNSTYTARVAIGSSCTQHRLDYSSRGCSSVLCSTFLIRPQLDSDLLQLGWLWAVWEEGELINYFHLPISKRSTPLTLPQTAPSDHSGRGAGESSRGVWQTDRSDFIGKRHRAVQSEHRNVVVLPMKWKYFHAIIHLFNKSYVGT